MVALSIASYLSLYPVLLLPPLILLGYNQRGLTKTSDLVAFVVAKVAVAACTVTGLLYLSYLVTGGSWEFISSTYGFHLLLPDLTPNVGLWWYFFIEMFDSFRAFFLGVFWLHLAGYVGGLCLRLWSVSRSK